MHGNGPTRRGMLSGALALAGVAASGQAMADDSLWSARQAHEALLSGDLVLLDIRSRAEWLETGVAEGAWPVSMHDPDFGRNLNRVFGLLEGRTLGFICATGGRTAYIQKVLRQNGVTDTVDVSEGMMGSPKGSGWIKAGLPVVTLDAALAGLPRELAR